MVATRRHEPSVGSVGPSYDHVVAEANIGVYKAILIHCTARCTCLPMRANMLTSASMVNFSTL